MSPIVRKPAELTALLGLLFGLVFGLAAALAAGPANAADLPPMIGEIADPGRAVDGTPSPEWVADVLTPRCTAVRVAELEELCQGSDHPHCAALAEKLTADAYPGEVMALVEIFRAQYKDPGASGAGALLAADLKSCEGFQLDIQQ